LTLISVAFSEQVRAERAYLGNFWFGMLTKLAYNTMFILFIDQLYHRVGQLGDFTKNEFLLVYLISQLGFYICYYGIFFPLKKLLLQVRNGSFDLLLLKPVPHRAFLYISGMSAFELLLTALPSLFILGGLIDWGTIHVSAASITLGLAVWLSGIIICNTVLFALVLPVFKNGDASDSLDVFYSITSMGQQPYSKLPGAMQVAALVIFPQIIIAGATSEVLLMKSDMLGVPLIAGIAAVIAVIVAQLLWRYALRHYTSASS
ncbi:MAG TPA: ABC-2 family transporter protein, partial [Magnetospirillaceae bacterium]|nr:ABC-2 family transporter protein [Magnetospirillaceae bacterium]